MKDTVTQDGTRGITLDLADGEFACLSYVEKSGSGTGEILDKCVAYGLSRPEFEPTAGFFKTVIWRASSGVRTSAPSQGLVGTQSAPSRHLVAALSRGTQSRHPVCDEGEKAIHERVIALCDVPRSTKELLEKVGRRDRTKFKRFVLRALMEDGILEWTIPDKPNSRLQKYRLTNKGRALAAMLTKKNSQKPQNT
jgi:predicted HTH transcriptional regulator